MNKLKVGDKVQFRFFNTPEGKFYGEVREGMIIGVPNNKNDKYEVAYMNGNFTWLARKEILRRI